MKGRAASPWTIGSIVFLFFFRARYAFTIYSGLDDLSYVLWLKKLMGLPSPINFSNSSYAPGIGVLWLPAGLLSRFLARWWPFELVLPTLIGLSSFLMWVMSYLLLVLIVKKFNQQNPVTPIPSRWALLWILAMPLLFYATNRTTLAHPGEVFIALCVIWMLQRQRLIAAVFLSAFLTLIRLNDVFVFALLAGFMLDARDWREGLMSMKVKALLLLGASASAVCAAWALRVALVRGYNGVTAWRILRNLSMSHLAHVAVGPEWGLLYMGPVWLMIFILGLIRWRTLSWTARGAWVWMLGEFLICAGWPDNGMEFGYRYLLGAYVAAIPVYFNLRRTTLSEQANSRMQSFLGLSAAWMCYLTWIYKSNAEVTIGPTPQGYGNPSMQLQALRQWLHPMRILRPLFLTPPAAVSYSWFWPHYPLAARYALSGFPLLALSLVTAAAIAVFCLVFLTENCILDSIR